MSAGRVEPGLFFRPRKFDLTSSRFTRISIWWGKVMSTLLNGDMGSAAEYAITFNDGSLLSLSTVSTLRLILHSS